MHNIIELQGAIRTYHRGSEEIRAVDGMSLSVQEGDYLSIVGPSGSGKTTLLNLIGCVDRPTEGMVRVHGIEVEGLTDKALAAIRSTSIGFVFQHFFLIPTLNALENVMLPTRFCKKRAGDRESRALELLELVGMAERAQHRPSQLSGGEMQRVAIARALVNDPVLLLADEPTGNLDSRRAQEIVRLFKELNDNGLTIVVVTHNQDLANDSMRSIYLKDGHIDDDVRRRSPAGLAVKPAGEPEVPDYVPLERQRDWGPAIPAMLALLLGSGLITSLFLNWYGGLTGYRLMTMYSYPYALYQGNWVWRIYAGNHAVLLTGFWPLLCALMLLAAVVLGLFRWKGTRWLLLVSAGLAMTVAAFNLISIYAMLQPEGPNPPNYAGYFHPGVGMWILAGSAAAILGLAVWAVLSGARDKKEVQRGSNT